ncbi:MAG: hypothetical protein H7210_06490 [Pyrinomonadaceae bacterium]|nr:hypothetical protein [Phycisphaerales bacterium]
MSQYVFTLVAATNLNRLTEDAPEVVSKLIQSLRRIAKQAEVKYKHDKADDESLRVFVISEYLIMFRYRPDLRCVEILHILQTGNQLTENGGKFRLRDGSVAGKGTTPEFREGDFQSMRDLIYAGRGA